MTSSASRPGEGSLRSPVAVAVLMLAGGVWSATADTTPPGKLAIDGPAWDDGLAEMSYYAATDAIYGQRRHFTRVHLMNRQWMDAASGVKASPDTAGAIAVFKFVVAERVPTENYDYRYLSTTFLRRDDLSPFKVTVSSQEWCGTTFKHLRWGDDGLVVQSFSYFTNEGNRAWQRPAERVPYEALFVIAREVAASGQGRSILLLPSLRSNHAVAPDPVPARLEPEGEPRQIKVPMGKFRARRVVLSGGPAQATFEVEADHPYRLLAFAAGGVTAKLQLVERRAYWDRSARSGFYKPGRAP